MSSTLKKTIYWSLFIVIAVIVVFIFLIPLFIMLYFPNSEIVSHFSNIIGIASTIVGALSAGLGFFSIFQANQGNKQVSKILDTVQSIESSQQMMFSKLSECGTSVVQGTCPPSEKEEWEKDNFKS